MERATARRLAMAGREQGGTQTDGSAVVLAQAGRSRLARRGVAAAVLGAGAVVLAACGSSPSATSTVPRVTGNAPWMIQQTAASHGSSGSGVASSETVKLQIKGVTTPEGSEPAYVGSGGVGAAVLFTAKVGEKVTVVVTDHDVMPHTFTSPDLGVDADISPGSSTTFTFTPTAAGTYTWYCSVPCGDWVMSHVGYMKGSVTVTS